MDETLILRGIRDDIQRTGNLTEKEKQRLVEVFQKRFSQAQELVDLGRVAKYMFKPSGRIIWAVVGKHGEHQVLPESMFCTCDDYFYRVMGGKKQVCYHIVAQQLASALGKHSTSGLADKEYSRITAKWSPRSDRLSKNP